MWLRLLALASLTCAQLQANAPWPAFMRNGQHTGATLDAGPLCAGPDPALNRDTFAWRVPLPGGEPLHTSTYSDFQFYASQVSVSRERILYAASHNGNISAFQLGATPTTPPSLLWTRSCGGAGCAFDFAPTLSEDGVLYAASMARSNSSLVNCAAIQGGTTSTLFALNATTGVTLWSRLFSGQVHSPALTRGNVFVTSELNSYPFPAGTNQQRGDLSEGVGEGPCVNFLALNAADGSLRYSLFSGYGYGSINLIPALSPDGGVVYVVNYNGGLAALQAASGVPLWVFSNSTDSRGTVSLSSPSVSASGDTVYTSLYTNSQLGSFIALDARTGTMLWRFVLGQGGSNCACSGGYTTAAISPSTGDLYFSSTCGGLFALHANGTLKWAQCGSGFKYTTPFSIGASDALYFGVTSYFFTNVPAPLSGIVMAVDGGSGAQLWAFQPTCDPNGANNPAGCNGRFPGQNNGVLLQPPVVLNSSLLFAASGYVFALGSSAACPTAPPSPAAAGSSQGPSPGAVAGAVLGSLAAAGLLYAGWAQCQAASAKGAARGEEALLKHTTY
jgi:outer membrane protein assembly factor BamB